MLFSTRGMFRTIIFIFSGMPFSSLIFLSHIFNALFFYIVEEKHHLDAIYIQTKLTSNMNNTG